MFYTSLLDPFGVVATRPSVAQVIFPVWAAFLVFECVYSLELDQLSTIYEWLRFQSKVGMRKIQ